MFVKRTRQIFAFQKASRPLEKRSYQSYEPKLFFQQQVQVIGRV